MIGGNQIAKNDKKYAVIVLETALPSFAQRSYMMENKTVLMCVLKETAAESFQERVQEKNTTAFIIFSEPVQIVGNGFRVYK